MGVAPGAIGAFKFGWLVVIKKQPCFGDK